MKKPMRLAGKKTVPVKKKIADDFEDDPDDLDTADPDAEEESIFDEDEEETEKEETEDDETEDEDEKEDEEDETDDEDETEDETESEDGDEEASPTKSAVVARGAKADRVAEKSYAARRALRRPTVALKEATPCDVRFRDPTDYALVRMHLFRSGVAKSMNNWMTMLCGGSSCYLCAKNLDAMDVYVYEVINRTGYVSKKNGAPKQITNVPATVEMRPKWHRAFQQIVKSTDISRSDVRMIRSGSDLVFRLGKPKKKPEDRQIPRLNVESLYVAPTKDMMKRAYSQLIV